MHTLIYRSSHDLSPNDSTVAPTGLKIHINLQLLDGQCSRSLDTSRLLNDSDGRKFFYLIKRIGTALRLWKLGSLDDSRIRLEIHVDFHERYEGTYFIWCQVTIRSLAATLEFPANVKMNNGICRSNFFTTQLRAPKLNRCQCNIFK